MQPDQLNLSVDPANDSNPVVEVYDRYEELTNRTTYVGAAHLPDKRDTVALYRSQPTKTGNFKGVGKTAVKLTNDVEVSGVDSSTTLTAPIILELSASVPVGTTEAELIHALQRMVALLDDNSFCTKLMLQMRI